MIIDGKQIASQILTELKNKPAPKKFLAAVLFGEDKASFGFLNKKKEVAKELGIDFRIYKFNSGHPTSGEYRTSYIAWDNDRARAEVLKIAGHKTCGGVIVQLPLPDHLNKHYVLNVIPREKDVDVLGERALGAFYTGRNPVLPPAVSVTQKIIENCKLKIENYRVAVVGAGFLVGRPVATWLTGRAKEVCVLDKGSDLRALKNADIVISGTGVPGLIKPDVLKENALVIDFGYSLDKNSKITGDFAIENAQRPLDIERLKFTPTPGGTGPILVACLLENFYKLNASTR